MVNIWFNMFFGLYIYIYLLNKPIYFFKIFHMIFDFCLSCFLNKMVIMFFEWLKTVLSYLWFINGFNKGAFTAGVQVQWS